MMLSRILRNLGEARKSDFGSIRVLVLACIKRRAFEA